MASLYRRGKSYYVCYRAGGQLVRKSVGPSERVARLRLAEVDVALQTGRGWLPHTLSGKPLPERTEEALEKAKTDLAPRTYVRYREMAAMLLRYFGKQEITPAGLERYKAHRIGQGVRCKTVNNELVFARSLYHGNGMNPLHCVKNLKTRDSKEVRFLTWGEAQLLVSACRAERHSRHCPTGKDIRMREDLADYVEAYLLTGCRLSELFALRWEDIGERSIRVTNLKTFRCVREKYRFIPIHPRLGEILEARRGLAAPFPLVRPNSLLRSVARAAARAGLHGAVGIHTLRHTFASLLVQHGVSLYVVSKLLGHSSQRTTEIYSHLVPATLHDAMKLLLPTGAVSNTVGQHSPV